MNAIKQSGSEEYLTYEFIAPFLDKLLGSLSTDSRLNQVVHGHARSLLEQREYTGGELMGRLSSFIIGYIKAGQVDPDVAAISADENSKNNIKFMDIKEIISGISPEPGMDAHLLDLASIHAQELNKQGKYSLEQLRERMDSFVLGYVEHHHASR